MEGFSLRPPSHHLQPPAGKGPVIPWGSHGGRARTVRVIEEEAATGPVPHLYHPEWTERFPWLSQGTTVRGEAGEDPFDLALFGVAGGGEGVWRRWEALAAEADARMVVHGAQLHGTAIRHHDGVRPGLHLSWEADGHVSSARGILMAVTLADCVPVFLLAPKARTACLLHAGWRGVAAGILPKAVATLRDRLAVEAGELLLHAGPSICGSCYEVGPEVHEALGLGVPESPEPVDLRGLLAEAASRHGVPDAAITVSAHCTLCGPGDLFSHRGGDRERQVGFLGLRDPVR